MPPIPELEAIRRTQILSAAIKVIGTHGYANVTMSDIAREANLSKGGMAHYFASKDDLFKEAFKAYYDQILSLFKNGIEQCSGPMEKILGFGLPLFIRETPDVSFAHKIVYDFMSLAAHNENYRELFSTWINEWVAVKKQALDDGIVAGVFIDHDTTRTARTISAIFHGIYLRWYLDPDNHTVSWAEEAFTEAINAYLKPYKVDQA
ncbi:MAG: TetR/AcrR family transcriptional regulator [Proteobacteria bacterium]|nr:TetR/AcrR family transcriptional regulator [Pseudomonadota bacterium]